MTSAENLRHPIFGLPFAGYVEWCHKQKIAPEGRVFVAMVAHRFRLDRNRGKCMNVLNLMQIPLVSFSAHDVEDFVRRVRLVLSTLDHDDIKDPDLLFTWLWEKFKDYQPIASKCVMF